MARLSFWSLGILSSVLALTSCGPGGGTYCQSGPTYGTQCYASPDLQRGPYAHPSSAEPERPSQSAAPTQRKWWKK